MKIEKLSDGEYEVITGETKRKVDLILDKDWLLLCKLPDNPMPVIVKPRYCLDEIITTLAKEMGIEEEGK